MVEWTREQAKFSYFVWRAAKICQWIPKHPIFGIHYRCVQLFRLRNLSTAQYHSVWSLRHTREYSVPLFAPKIKALHLLRKLGLVFPAGSNFPDSRYRLSSRNLLRHNSIQGNRGHRKLAMQHGLTSETTNWLSHRSFLQTIARTFHQSHVSQVPKRAVLQMAVQGLMLFPVLPITTWWGFRKELHKRNYTVLPKILLTLPTEVPYHLYATKSRKN